MTTGDGFSPHRPADRDAQIAFECGICGLRRSPEREARGFSVQSMTSREIVRRCIEFDHPSRVGLHFAVTPINGGFMVKACQLPNAIGMSIAESEAQHQAFLSCAEYPLQPSPPAR